MSFVVYLKYTHKCTSSTPAPPRATRTFIHEIRMKTRPTTSHIALRASPMSTEVPPPEISQNCPISRPSCRILAFVADWHAVDTLRASVDAAGLTDHLLIHHISALPSLKSITSHTPSPSKHAA